MDKYVLIEYSSTIKTSMYETFKHTQRIKLISFDVSNNYIILGSSSGGIYIFKRMPCEFLRLIPSKEGPTIQVQISTDEKNLALASSRGFVIILENFFDDLNLRPLLHSEHEGNIVTMMTWHGNNLYCGDNFGKISVCTVNSTLTKAIFQTPSASLMKLDSSIVQIDTYKNYLLISSKTRTYLCDIEKEQYKQIGKRLRDGNYGGCFSHADLSDYSDKNQGARGAFRTIEGEENFCSMSNNNDVQIYCARPGARLWHVNFEATVLATYQFRNSLSETSSDLLTLDSAEDARLYIKEFDGIKISEDFNFTKVYPLYPNVILTYDNKGIYFFEVETSSLICWSHNFDNIRDIKILKPHIYIWRNDLQINIISLQPLEEIIISTLFNKQYLLCSELCTTFSGDVLSLMRKSKKINLIAVLRRKLKEIGADEALERIKNILDTFDEYYIEQILGIKSQNGAVLDDNQYFKSATCLPEHSKSSNVNSSGDEHLKILYKQYVLNKTHKFAELTESGKILNRTDLKEVISLLESFIEYVKETNDEDASVWCKAQLIKSASRNCYNLRDLEPSILEYLNSAFLQLNDYKQDCCECKFPLPKAHRRKLEHFNLACELYDRAENKQDYLNNIPFLYKHKASGITKHLSLVLQFSDKDVFKECLDKITYDRWDEILKLFFKLTRGRCLNCAEKIDLQGIVSWTDLGNFMIASIGSKNATRLLTRYAQCIPKGQLGVKFYQSCIFAKTCEDQRLAVNLVDDVRNSGSPKMFDDSLQQFLCTKYLDIQSPLKITKSDVNAMKCSYCLLPLNSPILTDIKGCACGRSFHQICFNGNNNICTYCVNLTCD